MGELLILVQAPEIKIELPLRALFYNQIDIMGTSMGSSEEFNEMIKFIEKYKIKPIMDKVYSLEEAIQALRRMGAGRTVW